MSASKNLRSFTTFLLAIFSLTCFPAIAQFSQKQKVIDSLEKELVSAKADTLKINLLQRLSKLLSCKDSLQKINFAEEAFSLAEKIHWPRGMHLSLIRMGDYYQSCVMNYPKAISSYLKLEEISVNENDTEMLCTAYHELALLHKRTGEYGLTLEYYNKIIAIDPGNDALMATWGNIGELYRSLGDYTNALSSYEISLKIVNDVILSDKKNAANYQLLQAGLLTTVAEIYITMLEYEKAQSNYENILAINKLVPNKSIECYAYKGLGQTWLLKKYFGKSIHNYELALTAARDGHVTGYEEAILDDMANVYLQNDETKKALSFSMQSLALVEKNKNRPQLAVAYTTLGKIYLHEKKYVDAIKHLQLATSIAKEINAKNDEKNAWEVLSSAYTQSGETALAFSAYKQFITLRDSIYNTDNAKELTRLDMQGAFDRKQVADSLKQAADKKIASLKLQRQRVFTFSAIGGFVLVLLLSFFIYRNYSNAKKANTEISLAHEIIKEEKQVSENLLLNILPEQVAEELKSKGHVSARQFDNVTILFTDFVGFSTISERLSPGELVEELHACFKAFDEIIGKYGIEKIKTVGDAYLAAAGLPEANPDHAADIIHAAIEIRDFMMARKQQLGERSFGIRLGVNSGTVVAGIVGVKKFAYDIWGDTVNIAARMEQNSEAGKINISHDTYEIVKAQFTCVYRGELEAKNKGRLKMYYVG